MDLESLIPTILFFMRRNLFEVIGMAGVERIHSQMLAWIFDANVLTAAHKAEILTELTGQADKYVTVRVYTEYNYRDILIETESAIIVIENKIKSTEHDEQLTRYQQALERYALPRRFIYLSLLPEDITNSNWTRKTYDDLHSTLSRHVFTSPSNFDEYVFNEYVHAVGDLVAVVKSFDRNHADFPNVFTEGSLSKHDKCVRVSENTNLQNYVRANQLETALQRHFIAKIRKRVVPSAARYRIEETHGVALLQIVIADLMFDGLKFELGIQFQGKTAKLNCAAHDYANSSCNQLPRKVKVEFQKKGKNLRVNLPHTKAYVSLSKKLEFDWSDTFEEIIEVYQVAYAELSAMGESMARRWPRSRS